jgi:hypothetical protein
VKESTIARSVLEVELLFKLPRDSRAFAYLALPVRVCRPGTCVSGKITFTCQPFYHEAVKARWELHIATSSRRGPFRDERIKLDTAILQQFAQETNAGRVVDPDETRMPAGATQEQVDAIEAALMTAPAEVWAQFLDVTFLKNGLRYFRAPGAPSD